MIRFLVAFMVLVMCTSCITRVETSLDDAGPVKVDGLLDCTSNASWSMQGTPSPDAEGAETADAAIREALEAWVDRFDGRIEIIGETVGSLVLDGREQVVVTATKLPAGGWLVTTTDGCEGFELR